MSANVLLLTKNSCISHNSRRASQTLLPPMPRGIAAKRVRVKIRHSFPYKVDLSDLPLRYRSGLRVDDSLRFFDLLDVLTLATGSAPNALQLQTSWRRGLKGEQLGRLLQSVGRGVIECDEIVFIKWTEVNEPARGRARVAASARACDAILTLIIGAKNKKWDSEKYSKPQIQKFLIRVRNRTPPLCAASRRIYKAPTPPLSRVLTDIQTTSFETWTLTAQEAGERCSGLDDENLQLSDDEGPGNNDDFDEDEWEGGDEEEAGEEKKEEPEEKDGDWLAAAIEAASSGEEKEEEEEKD